MSLMSPSTRTLSSLRHLTTKKLPLKKPFSTNRIPLPRTPHPHQYELILSHPTFPNPAGKTTTTPRSTFSDSEPSFEDWVDKKLAHPSKNVHVPGMDKKKREYYNQRRKALYGEDSDDEREKRMKKGEVVELVPEVVEFKSLHEKEEELYFYDAIIVPWEKDKHYRMVYQLENKFFPGQGMDNAFLPGEKWGTNANRKAKDKAKAKAKDNVIDIDIDKHEDKDKDKEKEKDDELVFFGEKEKEEMRVDLSLKKVGEFFKGLRKKYNVTNNNKKDVKAVEGLDEGLGLDEPFLATRTTGLPVTWDSPGGTVVLVNKPKGWTSFTVCGKLRRLTNVRKVGHAGTLDPMATGLLIVCVGRATKIVDSYQGMVKGYSGTFRLGEATSTWDADSPVIQREPWEHVKDSDIKKAVASFRGEIWQVPPMFSAIKVGGEKMYDKARRGESIELSPRRISILKFDVERSLEDRQNLIFRVTCSKGTYIRSLCADLGKALGSCAHLTALRRDSIGDYSADDAFNFEELETLVTKKYV